MRAGAEIGKSDAFAVGFIGGNKRGTVTSGKMFSLIPRAAHIYRTGCMDNFFTGEFIGIGYDAFAYGDVFFLADDALTRFHETGTCRPMNRHVQRPAAYDKFNSGTIYNRIGFYPCNIALQ
jgi:hypothetical protein